MSKSMTLPSRNTTQTNGVLQGDPFSPLLFNTATTGAAQVILHDPGRQNCTYADDVVLI